MKRGMKKENEETMSDKYACYIVITCREPQTDGNMIVEMDWRGDPDLAQMLLQDAYDRIDMQMEEEEDLPAEYLAFDEEQVNGEGKELPRAGGDLW